MFNNNFVLMTDSYKVSHWNLYPQGIQKVHSYLESRGGKFGKTVFFGLQYYIQEYLIGQQVTQAKIDEADEFFKAYFGSDIFNRAGWEYILREHDGKLPLIIRAIPEGTVTKTGTVLMTIENTDPHCAWLVNYTETLLMKVWGAITVATQSFHIALGIRGFLERTGDNGGLPFKCHCFGYRGVFTEEQAAIAGGAHLLSFMGTDTLAAIRFLKQYYGAGMTGFSIPATEHSIICSFGGRENERDAFANLLEKYPKGLIACVSDTYDIYNACENLWGGEFREQILAREGVLVIRLDSGDYFEVAPKCLEILWNKFGGTVNEKGFKVLDPHVRIIQGDGMDHDSILALYAKLEELGWSADNLAVGSGGGLLQKMNRDTLKFAIKCSAVLINDEWIDVFKDPITDPGKRSKRGRYKTVEKAGEIFSVPNTYDAPGSTDLMETVFENGEMKKSYSYDEIKVNMERTKDFA